jgi:hypothetical protein
VHFDNKMCTVNNTEASWWKFHQKYGTGIWCRENKNEVINYTSNSDVTSHLSKEEVIKTAYEEFCKAVLNGWISKDHPDFSFSEIMCAKHKFIFDVTGMEDMSDFLGWFM